MVQADDSWQQQHAVFQPPFSSSLVLDDTRDFLSELDSFLQCVNEFEHGGNRFASSMSTSAATTAGEETLREEDLQATPFADPGDEMLDAFSINAVDLSQQCDSEANDQYKGRNHGADTDALSVCPHSRCGSSPGRVPVQPASKLKERKVLSKAQASKKRNQNRSRKRQREELERLRVSAQKLQHELERLLGCDVNSDGPLIVCPNGESRRPGNKELLTFLQQTLAWKRTASSEKQQSEQAAMENQKLRAIVEENLVICKNLRETTSNSRFAKVPSDLRVLHAHSSKSAAVPREVLMNESVIFATLRQGLDAQCQCISTIWDECKFTNSSADIEQPNRLKCDHEDNFYLEHVKSRTFPFSANAVNRAIWKRIKGGVLTPNMGELKIRQVTENTVYATLVDTIAIPNAPESKLKTWISLKRFIQADQIVMVWQARVDIEHSTRIHLTESGWNVVKSLREAGKKGESGLGVAPCISQTCIRSTPDQRCGAISKEEFADGGLNAKVVAQYHENMAMLSQTIENYLIDESLARGCGGGGKRSILRIELARLTDSLMMAPLAGTDGATAARLPIDESLLYELLAPENTTRYVPAGDDADAETQDMVPEAAATACSSSADAREDEGHELMLLLGLHDGDEEIENILGGDGVCGGVPSDVGSDDSSDRNEDAGENSLFELLCLHDADALVIESESEESSDDDVNQDSSVFECRGESVHSNVDCVTPANITDNPSSELEGGKGIAASSPTLKHTPTPSTKEKPRRNRKRPKQEMDALRIEEKELSEKLAKLQEQLQQQQDALTASSQEGSLVVKIAVNTEKSCSVVAPWRQSGIASSQPPSMLLPSSAGVWQSLAWFQREDVRAAINENTRLRTLFQYQLQILSRLDAMYHQFSSVTELAALQLDYNDCAGGTAGVSALTKRPRVDPFDDDFVIFASLGQDFDAQYAKTESIFESTGLATLDGWLRQEMLPKRGANGIYFLESLHSKTIPYDMHAHDAMTWSVLASEDLHAHHGAYEVRELTHDLVCRKIVNKIQLPLGESTLIRRTALKRYIEDDRVVVVWDAVLEVTGSVSMRLRERGWKILRRPHVIPANLEGSDSPITVEQWCVRVTPEQSTTYSEADIAAGSLTNAIVAAYRRHLKLMHHMDRNVFATQFKKALDTLASHLNS